MRKLKSKVRKFKQKTKRAAAKRFTLTKSGRIKHRSTGRGHILRRSKKSPAQKRNLRTPGRALGDADKQSVRRQLCVE